MNRLLLLSLFVLASSLSAAPPTSPITLPDNPRSPDLLPDSPFGINTAFGPETKDLEARVIAMRNAGIKWGRQDFTWRSIEREKGVYDFSGYDRLVEICRKNGLSLFGDFAYAPRFHDPRTPEGAQAYADFAAAAAKRYAGKIDYWQIWNEPNGGYWSGNPDQYARILTLAGKAIHQANPKSKVLGLNMAFCDVIWAERILEQVPYDCFDIACFHPYRPPSAPEDKFDWWELDQYVKSWHKKDLDANYPLIRMTYLEQAEELVKVMAKFGQPKPLWITEICWNTHIHPYGTSELRQADLLVRFYVQSIASRKVQKVFWWTLKDGGTRQFDQADMVGIMRSDLTPKYAYFAFAWMTHMLEGKAWVRNDNFGPDIYTVTFTDDKSGQDTIVAWTPKPFAYIRVNNEEGLDIYDIYGVKRHVPMDPIRTRSLPIPLGESPIYIQGPKGLKATPRPDPGW